MAERKHFTIDLNKEAPTISEQVWMQDLRYDSKTLRHIEKLRQMMYTLLEEGVLNERGCIVPKEKLFRKIVSHIMRKNRMVWPAKSKHDEY